MRLCTCVHVVTVRFLVHRSRGDALVAIKEVPLSDVAMFGGNAADRDAGVSVAAKEVDILSSMSHPHVVQYYESFVEGQHLYIAMELVEVRQGGDDNMG